MLLSLSLSAAQNPDSLSLQIKTNLTAIQTHDNIPQTAITCVLTKSLFIPKKHTLKKMKCAAKRENNKQENLAKNSPYFTESQ
jgi:hypothetical protein